LLVAVGDHCGLISHGSVLSPRYNGSRLRGQLHVLQIQLAADEAFADV
jgi:hypothetical protein